MSKVDSNEGILSPALRRHLATIRDCERSGEAMKRYATRRGLSVHTLYQAKKTLRKKGFLSSPDVSAAAKSKAFSSPDKGASRFVEVVRRTEGREMDASWRVRLPGGVVFESNASLSTDEMLRLFKSLSGGKQA